MQENLQDLFGGEHCTDYLNVWKKALINSVRSEKPDLNCRQMALMLVVYLEDGPHTVRGLAAQLGVTKPVITRALNSLSQLGFIKRKTDPKDRRNLFVQRTVKGAVYLSEFADFIAGGTKDDDTGKSVYSTEPLAAVH